MLLQATVHGTVLSNHREAAGGVAWGPSAQVVVKPVLLVVVTAAAIIQLVPRVT